MTQALSAILRSNLSDFVNLYKEAKIADHNESMERLGKMIASLTKQIREHETHERETLTRREIETLAAVVGNACSTVLLEELEFEEAFPIIEKISERIQEAVENA